jgi:hypothetical protein
MRRRGASAATMQERGIDACGDACRGGGAEKHELGMKDPKYGHMHGLVSGLLTASALHSSLM